eukprot:gene4164-15625_t
MPPSLAPRDVALLRAAFAELDRDGNGYVDPAELEAEVGKVVRPLLPAGDDVRGVVASMIAAVDADADGRVNVDEFLAAFAEGTGAMDAAVAAAEMTSCDRIGANCAALDDVLGPEEVSLLIGVFHQLDLNQDGYVEPLELERSVAGLLCERMPDLGDDPRRLRAGGRFEDADGRLSLDEFLRSYIGEREHNGGGRGRDVLPRDMLGRVAAMPPEDQIEDLVIAFSDLDLNCDGFLDADEMFTALNGVLNTSSSAAQFAPIRSLTAARG